MLTTLGGLPVPSLSQKPAAGKAGGPAAEAVVNGETVRLGQMVTDPSTGLAEPVYNTAPGGDYGAWGFTGTQQPQQTDLADMDPVTIIEANRQAAAQQARVYDQQIALTQEPLQQQLATLDKQMQVDINAVYDMNLNEESRTNRISQIKTNYQKRAIQAQDKIAPQITRLQQAKAAALADAQLKATITAAKLAGVTAAAEQMGLSPARAKALQLNAVGISVPLTTFETSSGSQSLAQQSAMANQIIGESRRTLEQYQILSARSGWAVRDRPLTFKILKPITEWKNPQSDTRDESDYRDATPEEQAVAEEAIDNLDAAKQWQHEISTTRIGKRVQNLGAGLSPFGAGVRQSLPKRAGTGTSLAPAETLSQMSDAELRRIASGGR